MKKQSHPTEVIAVRTLDLLNEADELVDAVTVTLFRPEELPNSAGFSCSYRIHGLSTELVKEGRGSDAMQALLLTLAKIGADLYTSSEANTGRLRWCGDGNLGFPVFMMLNDKVPEPKDQLVL